jgi:hypothetical protein
MAMCTLSCPEAEELIEEIGTFCDDNENKNDNDKESQDPVETFNKTYMEKDWFDRFWELMTEDSMIQQFNTPDTEHENDPFVYEEFYDKENNRVWVIEISPTRTFSEPNKNPVFLDRGSVATWEITDRYLFGRIHTYSTLALPTDVVEGELH